MTTTLTKPARRAKPEPAEPTAPERGPRGEHLDRHGVVVATRGALRGYVVVLSFAEFEVVRHPDRAGYRVVCRLHGTASEPIATKAAAERAGARAARRAWCSACEEAAR